MKKITALIMALAITLALAGCGSTSNPENTETDTTSADAETSYGDDNVAISETDEDQEESDSQATDSTEIKDSSDTDAYELYTAALEKAQAATAVDMSTNVDMSMTAGGQAVSTQSSGRIQQIVRDSDAEFSATTSNTAGGSAYELNAYYTDGYYYMDISGMKYKAQLSIGEALAQVVSTNAVEFAESDVIDQTVTGVSGGSKITFVLSGQSVSSTFSSAMTSLESDSGDQYALTVSDATLEVSISGEGVLQSTQLTMSAEMTMSGETVPVSMVVSAEYLAFGDSVVVQLPEDLDTYEEVDASSLGL